MTPARPTLARVAADAAGAVMLPGDASPAAAHGGGGESNGTNCRSEILDPGVDGLTWRVIHGDGSVEPSNTTGIEIVVLGYRDEPYLRFTPARGVHRNATSPATYLDEGRLGDAEIQADTSAHAEFLSAGLAALWCAHTRPDVATAHSSTVPDDSTGPQSNP